MLKHLARYSYISRNIENKIKILVLIVNVVNFSCPKMIKTLSLLNLILFTFQNFISINQENLIIKHDQKSTQTLHFKLYVGFKKGPMRPFPRCDFSIIEIVGFYNFKCIPCFFPRNNRPFLN